MHFELNENLGRRIIADLSEIVDLPFEGILAGGAVANWIISKAWGIDAPINDLDIFRLKFVSRLDENGDGPEVMPTNLGNLKHARYSLPEVALTRENAARICEASREGMLNYIDVEMVNLESRWGARRKRVADASVWQLLSTFDLNCCQVGIDLETSRLYFLPAFDEFVKSRQLTVEYAGTPFQTFLRLHKKADELPGCYCDFESEARGLATVIDFAENTYDNFERKSDTYVVKEITPCFGPKHYPTYLKYEGEISKYASLETVRKPEMDVDYWKLSFDIESDWESMKGLREDYFGVLAFYQCWAKMYKPTVSDHKKRLAKNCLGDEFSFTQLVTCPTFLNGDFHLKHVKSAVKFLDLHDSLKAEVVIRKLPMAQIYRLTKTIKHAEKKHGLWLTGLVEKYLEKDEPVDELTPAKLDEMAEDFLKDLSPEPLIEPVDLTGFKHAENVVELVSRKDLVLEGETMHHCVGGYHNQVKDGSTRIFHIRCGKHESTVEFSVKDNSFGHQPRLKKESVVRGQHKSYCNADPHESCNNVVKELQKFLDPIFADSFQTKQTFSILEIAPQRAKSRFVEALRFFSESCSWSLLYIKARFMSLYMKREEVEKNPAILYGAETAEAPFNPENLDQIPF